MRTQLRLLRYLWPRWPSLITLLVTMGFGVAVDLARPWPIKLLVDNVLGGKHLSHSIHDVVYSLPGPGGRDQLLFWVVIATVLIFLAANLLAMAGTYASVGLGERITYDVGADVFAHLQRLSLTYHARRAAASAPGRSCVHSDAGASRGCGSPCSWGERLASGRQQSCAWERSA